LHFFNKLRNSTFRLDGLKRYLVYAIGEIVLVVLEILIALQINNGNEDRKQEEQFYKGLPVFTPNSSNKINCLIMSGK
jgi:hypothetical protein